MIKRGEWVGNTKRKLKKDVHGKWLQRRVGSGYKGKDDIKWEGKWMEISKRGLKKGDIIKRSGLYGEKEKKNMGAEWNREKENK